MPAPSAPDLQRPSARAARTSPLGLLASGGLPTPARMQARLRGSAGRCVAHLRANAAPDLAEAPPTAAAAPCGCCSASPASPGLPRGSASSAWGLPAQAGPPWPLGATGCLPSMAAVLAAPADAGAAPVGLHQGGAAELRGGSSGGSGKAEPDLRAVEQELRGVLSQFPAVRHAFAYGSGVFEQPGLYAAAGGSGACARPMLDFIFAVDSPIDWHHEVGAVELEGCSSACLLDGSMYTLLICC